MAWPNDPWDKFLGPDYNPAMWSLGYQQRQFGVATDPGGRPPSVWSGLAEPPAAMTTAVEEASD